MKQTICAACGAGVDPNTTHDGLFRVPCEHAARLGGLPGVQANLALRVCDRCATRQLEELSPILKARVTAQVDAIITEASRNNTLPERCGYCGGPADMVHVQGHRHGCDVLFDSCESCRQDSTDAEREVER
jgi:hypothetical protein